MALWNKATEIEVPPCATCKGEKFIKTHGKLKPCPTCSQPINPLNSTPYNPFEIGDDTFSNSGLGRTWSDEELST